MSENLVDKQKAGPAKMADEAVVPQVSHIAASIMPPGPYNAANPHLMHGMSAFLDQFNTVKAPLPYDHPGNSLDRRGLSILNVLPHRGCNFAPLIATVKGFERLAEQTHDCIRA
jgi:hypothetical protein